MIEGQECITIPGPPLSSSAAIEVQEYYARKFELQVAPATPERRRSMRLKFRKKDWPHAWHSRNDDPIQAQLEQVERQQWATLHPRKRTKAATRG